MFKIHFPTSISKLNYKTNVTRFHFTKRLIPTQNMSTENADMSLVISALVTEIPIIHKGNAQMKCPLKTELWNWNEQFSKQNNVRRNLLTRTYGTEWLTCPCRVFQKKKKAPCLWRPSAAGILRKPYYYTFKIIRKNTHATRSFQSHPNCRQNAGERPSESFKTTFFTTSPQFIRPS